MGLQLEAVNSGLCRPEGVLDLVASVATKMYDYSSHRCWRGCLYFALCMWLCSWIFFLYVLVFAPYVAAGVRRLSGLWSDPGCWTSTSTECLQRNVNVSSTSSSVSLCVSPRAVDADEIKRLGKRFKKLDLDNSGSLSVEEFMSLPELQQNPLVQRVIDIFDTDGNGEVDFKGMQHILPVCACDLTDSFKWFD